MQTLRIFLVFCRLKWQEIWGWFKNNYLPFVAMFVAMFGLLIYIALYIYSQITHNKILEYCLLIPGFIVTIVVIIGLILGIVLSIIDLIRKIVKIIKSNWLEAKKIAEKKL